MKEMFNSYLEKLVGNTINFLAPSAAEQTTECKHDAMSHLQSPCETPQEKLHPHAPLTKEKRKKRRIPFIAFALVVVFTSLCLFSLLELQTVALATNTHALDNSASPSPEAAPKDQSIAFLQGQQSDILGPGPGYDPKACSHPYDTATGDNFCWNEIDFTWADRDVTCLHNAKYSPKTAWDVSMSDKHNQKLNLHLEARALNQNTCTDESICVSDNASRADKPEDPNEPIHDQSGGDDILCGNKACIDDQHGTTNECGDTTNSGKQRVYDRFSCEMIDKTSELEDQNWQYWQHPNWSETNAILYEGRQWFSTGVAINPSAYDPIGALYLPTTNLRNDSLKPSQSRPNCDATNHWTCPNDAAIIVYQYNGSIVKENSGNKYEETTPNYSATQFKENWGANANMPEAWNPGSEKVPVYWVVCGAQGGWAFPCSDFDANGPYRGNAPFITQEKDSQSLDSHQVNEVMISKDWLSGDPDYNADTHHVKLDPKTSQPETAPVSMPGHLVHTYLNDTVYQPWIHEKLFGYSMAVGFILITPVLILIGYQFIWASWTLGRADAMEAFGRIILSISAIAVSEQLAAMLINLANMFNTAVVGLHVALPYPTVTINNLESVFTLTKQGETIAKNPRALESFRGVVIPMDRWGCVANDFIALVANKFWTDLAGFVPFVGGLAKFIGNVFNAIDVAKHIGEFVMLILTIMLCTQVFMRVLLLNYYILTGPLAFGCWGLPGGVGQKVVSSWTKGFVSLLFAQTAQIFVLTTFPLILPPFPNLPADNQWGILAIFLQALPRILVLSATIKVPTVMGTGATKAIAQAGTVAGGAIAAAGVAAMNVV